MKRFTEVLRDRRTSDDGVALVAAVAVAIIGVAITVIVLTQAIVVTNDTARDRIRTLEVHSAESALDTMMSELATTSPCPGPDWSPMTVGEGPTETLVEVTIEYWGGNPKVKLDCTAGVLSGTPNYAVITTVSTPANPGPGIAPQRTFQAKVDLIPQSESIPGAALFAATGISTGGGFRLLPADPSAPAGVWIDTGNFVCNTNVQITGDLYVVDGSVTMQNGCTASGDVWAKTGYSNCCTVPNNVWQVGGDLTIRNGNLTLSNRTRIGGDIKVNGTVPIQAWAGNPWSTSTIGGSACATNLPNQCTGFTEFAPVGLPQIHLDLADWQPTPDGMNFERQYKARFGDAILRSWGYHTLPNTDWRVQQIKGNPCYIPGYMNSAPVKLPFPGSTTPTLFDMRDCSFQPNNPVTIELYADVAIFANSFYGSNGLVVKSGDGQPHRMWMIVPWGGGTEGRTETPITVNGSSVDYDPGNIQFDTGLTVNKPISLFVYTPELLNFPNKSDTYGQLYGRAVTVGEGSGKFFYTHVGVPGVNLAIPTSTAVGFEVAIVSKQELQN